MNIDSPAKLGEPKLAGAGEFYMGDSVAYPSFGMLRQSRYVCHLIKNL